MPNQTSSSRVYYVYWADVIFDYENYIDIIGSPFFRNSRLFSGEADCYAVPILDRTEMCYCLDSYLGLPYEYIDDNNINNNNNYSIEICPVNWSIEGFQYDSPYTPRWDMFCHELTVTLANKVYTESPIQY